MEIANLRSSSISGGLLLVDGKRGRRPVPVSYQVARGLENLAQGGDFIWRNRYGNPISAGTLPLAYRGIFEQAGIQGARPGAYTLRLTFAVRFIEAGGDPLDLMHILGRRDLNSAIKMGIASYRAIASAHAEFSPLSALEFDPDWA